jgi:hypothetical protein
MRDTLDALAARLARQAFSAEDLRAMVGGLVEDGLAGQYRDYAGAEQATMAIGSLLAFLGKRGELRDMAAVNAALDRLHATVKDDEKYRPDRFRDALADLGRIAGR